MTQVTFFFESHNSKRMDLTKLIWIRDQIHRIFTSPLVQYLLNLANTVYVHTEKSALEYVRNKIGFEREIKDRGWDILLKSLQPDQLTELKRRLNE